MRLGALVIMLTEKETYEDFRASATAYAKTHPFARMPLRPLGGEREGCYPDPQDAEWLPCDTVVDGGQEKFDAALATEKEEK